MNDELEWTPGLLLAFVDRCSSSERGSPVYAHYTFLPTVAGNGEFHVDFVPFAADSRPTRVHVRNAFAANYQILRLAGLIELERLLEDPEVVDVVVTDSGRRLVREHHFDVELVLALGDDLAIRRCDG